MLYTINRGNTGRPVGCQTSIVHLVSTVGAAAANGHNWAISDGNAGSPFTNFSDSLEFLNTLDWDAIQAKYWMDVRDKKQAEFLVADFYPFSQIHLIGCHDTDVADAVHKILMKSSHKPVVEVKNHWYY